MTKQHVGFSVILTTIDPKDVQKLAQIMQVFADESVSTSEIVVSTAHAWTVQNAAEARTVGMNPAIAAPYIGN